MHTADPFLSVYLSLLALSIGTVATSPLLSFCLSLVLVLSLPEVMSVSLPTELRL
jgi:hypothetical protein